MMIPEAPCYRQAQAMSSIMEGMGFRLGASQLNKRRR